MNWWEEAEARAHRTKGPAALALSLWQRLQAAGVDPDFALPPAYDLGHLHSLCADLVKLIEGILVAADGDGGAIRRQGLALARWARYAAEWAAASSAPFNQMMNSLELDPEDLARREEVLLHDAGARPEEESKLGGRYRHWHLLYERLDLKLASAGLEERVHRGLARSLARIYEECLITLQLIAALEKEPKPRLRHVARALLDINTVWHFDLGPYHLGPGSLRAAGNAPPGLQTWLLLAFAVWPPVSQP